MKAIALSSTLASRLESVRLRLLPRVARDCCWAVVDDLRLYGSADHQMYLYHLVKGSFEPLKMQLFKERIKPRMVVVDVGAYIGYHSVLASRLAGPQGRIFAFECDARNYRFLLHNIRLNNCQNTCPRLTAASNQAGTLTLFLQKDPAISNSGHQAAATSRLSVECATLDEMLDGQSVDVVKMSIQGGEVTALQGMERTLAVSKGAVLFVECSPATLRHAGFCVDDLVGQLQRLGFSLQVIDERGACLRELGKQDYLERTTQGRKNFFYLYCRKDV